MASRAAGDARRAPAHRNPIQQESTMASFVIVRHKVRDFNKWKPVYDAHKPKRIEAGLSEKHLFRSADDANEVIVLFEAQDLKRAKAFASSADLHHKMEEGGVVDKPTIYLLNS
jgi:hypothetical protein